MPINNITQISQLLYSPIGIFELFSVLIIVLCSFAVLVSILVDFVKFESRNEIKSEKKSIVATGTMLLFFLCFYFLIKNGIGRIEINSIQLKIVLVSFGLIIIVLGSITNIWGRFNLGKNWANHVKIYQNHELIETGVYKLVRHPLYASLIWAFYGASLVYFNVYAFLIITFIFVPFMFYRAKQEEKLLGKEFIHYNSYKLRVGMFFPKLLNKKENDKI